MRQKGLDEKVRSVAVRHEKFEKVWQEKMDRLSDRQFRGTALVIVVIGRWWCGIKCVWYCFGL